MGEHTPGPWIADTVDYHGKRAIRSECDGARIATVEHLDRVEDNANARLIAAAPAAMKVCRMLVGKVPEGGLPAVREAAKQAVAKVQGEEGDGE